MPHADPKPLTKRRSKFKTWNASTTAASENPASRADIYQRVTDQIVSAIEAGAGKWKMPWRTTQATNATRPINADSKKPYRGVDTLAL